MAEQKPVFKRVLLKLSGEALSGGKGSGLDFDVVTDVCRRIKECSDLGVQIAIVVGGGNFWRGRSSGEMDRTRADHMGMLATTINSLALQDAFEQLGVDARVLTAIEMREVAEPFTKPRAVSHLNEGKIVIFGCGTGCPFFSTDTAAALRAAEIGADVIFKATNVDGVYDKDPAKYSDAVKFVELTYTELLARGLKAIDQSAATIGEECDIKTVICPLSDPDNIISAAKGEKIGTLLHK